MMRFTCARTAAVFSAGKGSGFALRVHLYTLGLQPALRREKSERFHISFFGGFEFITDNSVAASLWGSYP